MNILEPLCGIFGSRNGMFLKGAEVNGKSRIITVVYMEGGTTKTCVLSIIIRKLCKGQYIRLVILVMVTIDAEILFNALVYSFYLTVGLWVESGRKTLFQIKGFCQ